MLNQVTLLHQLQKIRVSISVWVGQSALRRIFGATVLIVVVSAVAKLGTAVKELVIANYYGTSDALDAFLTAYLVLSFIVNIAASAFSVTVTPIYTEIKMIRGEEAAKTYLTSLAAWSMALLTILSIVMIVPARYYLPLLASGFVPEKLALTLRMVYVMTPLIFISGLSSLLLAFLNANRSFAAPALIPAVTPVVIMVGILTLRDRTGVFAIVIGLLAGQLIELVLSWLKAKKYLAALRLEDLKPDAYWRQTWRQFLPMAAGALVMGGNPLIDQAFAAALPAGSVSALSYGNRLISFPLTLAAGAMGTAVLPYFASMIARGDFEGVRNTLRKSLMAIFALSVPAALLLAVFSEPIVRILLQRGAFTGQDTRLVAQIQALAALQIPFYLGGIMLVRSISSFQSNQTLMWISGLNAVFNVIFNYLFIRWYGVAGIALSTSMVYLISFLLCWLALNQIFKSIQKQSR
jgi:putative peptidoglycan lipid II flippase